jgi:hypothetical protein
VAEASDAFEQDHFHDWSPWFGLIVVIVGSG